ncbi:MAG: hypothetical protein ACOYM9_10140 [Bradymonadia bacterium]
MAARPWPLLVLLLPTPACLLDETTCAEGFERSGDECVAAAARDARRVDVGPTDAVADALGRLDGDVIDAGSDGATPDPWAGTLSVLVLDRTPVEALGRAPLTPGCDVDAVALETSLGEPLSFGAVVLDAEVFDPFGQGIALEPTAAIGPPERVLDPARFVSLGGGGAYVLLGLESVRAPRRGDRVRVYELAEDDPVSDALDQCALWACPGAVADLATCRFIADRTDETPAPLE